MQEAYFLTFRSPGILLNLALKLLITTVIFKGIIV